MFREDQPRIEEWARACPDRTTDVGLFVLLTIRQQFGGIGKLLERVRAGDYAPLWGFKHDGYLYLREHQEYLHERADRARMGHIWVNDLLRDYLAVPGLGLVKAGFCVQLLIGEAGCMDMHNLARFGIPEREFAIPERKDPDAQLRATDEAIKHYLWTCERFGGTEKLWDGWCEFVAQTYRTYEDAEDVSRRHVTYLTGETT
jgi:hypothetical protein